ncbi:hypothetical protein Micbo1qcDRAFT_167094, partial [Microdochium bolleyi]
MAKVHFVHRTARDFMLDRGRHMWQNVSLDWKACVDAQYLCLWSGPIPSHSFPGGDWDGKLVQQCAAYDHGLPSNMTDGPLDYLAEIMCAKSHWSLDQRNPAVVGICSNTRIPEHWIVAWQPTQMSSETFLNHLLLYAAECSNHEITLWLLEQGGNPFWHDMSELRGIQWPTAFQFIASNLSTSSDTDCTFSKPFCRVLQHHSLKLDDEIVVLWSMDPKVKFYFVPM